MYLDMVVPPGGILARISPPDGKASYLGFNDNPVRKYAYLKLKSEQNAY